MGVGVYASNFNGKGSTFLVDGLIYDLEEAYEDYVRDVGEEEACNYELYAEDQYRSLYEDFVGVLQDGSRSFFSAVQSHLDTEGQKLPELGTYEDGWAEFDSQFRVVYDYYADIQVGIRQWESDYVVGVSLTKDPMDDIPINIVLQYGLCREDYKDHQVMMVDALATYLRYHLAENGYTPRYRTSAWTSAAYPTDNAEAEKEKAIKGFTDLYLASARSGAEILAENFWRQREEATARILIEDLLFEGRWNYWTDQGYANYVVYDSDSEQVVLLDAEWFEVVEETGIKIEDPQRFLLTDPDLGYQVLDLDNRENVELITKLQRTAKDKILITPQAFEKAFKRDLFEEIQRVYDIPTP